MKNTRSRKDRRMKRKAGIQAKIRGTADRPRMSIFRSNRNLCVQLIDDIKGRTMVSVKGSGKNMTEAKALGSDIAKGAVSKGIEHVVFDRGGYRYHGVVKAIADAAREGGLKF